MFQFLIPLLISGGVQIIQPVIIDAIIKKQDKKKFKSVLIDTVDKLRKEAANQLDDIGKKKIDIYLDSIKEYMTLYTKIVGKNETLLEMIDNPLSPEEIKWIVDAIDKAERLLKEGKGEITKQASIGWAVFGCKVVENHSYPEGNHPYNSTVMWLGDECFRKDDKKGYYMCLFDGKIPGYLLHLFKFNSWDGDVKHYNDLLDPKKFFSGEELKNLFTHQLPDTFNEFKVLMDLYLERLIHSEYQLKAENIRLREIANKLNGSKSSNKIAALLINESIPILQELVYFDSTYVFTTRGAYTDRFIDICRNDSENILYSISDSELKIYIKRFLDVKTATEAKMSEINIKIIDSDEYSKNTEYFKYDENEEEWVQFSKDLMMELNRKHCQKLSKDNMDSLFEIFDEYMAITDLPTSIYYIGEKAMFEDLNSYIAKRYNDVNIFKI